MLKQTNEDDIKPENIPEKVVWWAIANTYSIWVFGGLYVVGALLGWILLLFLLIKILAQTEDTPEDEKITISLSLWVWIAGMLMMQVALIAGHLDYNLPTGLIIKSSIGWAKGWAALALYPLAGCLKIRPQIIYRAVCIVGLHTLLIIPFLLLAPSLHLPQVLYVSPLKAVGGPGNEFFDVPLYEIDGSTGDLRWRLFTPWGPALGFVGNVNFMLALQEKNKKWRRLGLAGSVVMCFVCKSRMAQVCIVIIPLLTNVLSSLTRPRMLIGMGFFNFLAGIFAPSIIVAFNNFWEGFKAARAGSTRVRMALKEIAVYRWKTEAPIWGHGVVEEGPHIVEYMPIGSHHSWAGLLFVKGIVGFMALAIPLGFSFFDLLIKSTDSRRPTAQVGLSIVMILFLYTFGENLEILVYLYWHGLLVMGIGFQEKPKSQPLVTIT
ncbi:O-antigen ligase domain-containing protein [Dolichospermum sp. UHCC 0259]|uniref:O-antigen ligase domain-containing protein n=1 Tax=Dolichospermum sp. UHCC 0259 TaxID=2590010 RepID=UPI001444CA23|nr:O-antigen ligase domain-containing protein [Dolichospermum sp. UHCC 0259]MTJ48800.1 O-antigen ligase domain-containing protein [Dolichospermum sp. UHCC 0259]